MSKRNEELATRRDLLEWILHIIDARIKEEELMLQSHSDDSKEALYFRARLKRDHAARDLISDELKKCDDCDE